MDNFKIVVVYNIDLLFMLYVGWVLIVVIFGCVFGYKVSGV